VPEELFLVLGSGGITKALWSHQKLCEEVKITSQKLTFYCLSAEWNPTFSTSLLCSWLWPSLWKKVSGLFRKMKKLHSTLYLWRLTVLTLWKGPNSVGEKS
jgi:hypothetical protein